MSETSTSFGWYKVTQWISILTIWNSNLAVSFYPEEVVFSISNCYKTYQLMSKEFRALLWRATEEEKTKETPSYFWFIELNRWMDGKTSPLIFNHKLSSTERNAVEYDDCELNFDLWNSLLFDLLVNKIVVFFLETYTANFIDYLRIMKLIWNWFSMVSKLLIFVNNRYQHIIYILEI